MPFTLVAFLESQNAGTLLNIAGLADPHVRVSGDDIWIPAALPMMAGYYVIIDAGTDARIESPTLRTLAPIDVCPFDVGTEPGSPPLAKLQQLSPKTLGPTEALNLKATGTAKFRTVGLIWLCDGPLAPVTGEIFTVECSTTLTTTALAWSNGALTFGQTLPSGRYAVVGMRAKSTTLLAARLVFPGYLWRPGCIGNDSDQDIERDEFRHGRLGVWGEFDHDVPPTVDFLTVSAESGAVVWLDLIKIA